jgi:hypothetical protein
MAQREDKPPGLTQLAEAVGRHAKRERGWTRELPTIARRWGGIPLTVGGAIGIFAALMKLWTFGAGIEDRVSQKVAREIRVHDESGKAHHDRLAELTELNRRTWQTVIELQVSLRQLRDKVAELSEPPRSRHRR